MGQETSSNIFRAYDIRGIYNKDLFPGTFEKIGRALGTLISEKGLEPKVTVGEDVRKPSKLLTYPLISGIAAMGVDVEYVGTTSFGQTLFSGLRLEGGVTAYITASHLPPEWGGVKLYYGDGVGFSVEDNLRIKELFFGKCLEGKDWEDVGNVRYSDFKVEYSTFFKENIELKRPVKVVVDSGNGSTCLSAPNAFKAAGFSVVGLFSEVDPTFPNRPSNPKAENLSQLIQTVKDTGADFGVAFDGDGDRSVIVDGKGVVLSAEETAIILGRSLLKGRDGAVTLMTVDCSMSLKEEMERLGSVVRTIPVGHTYLTLEAKRSNAVLGTESSGHIIIPEYFLFDDAMIVPMKMGEILSGEGTSLHDMVEGLPKYETVRDKVHCPDELKFEVMDRLSRDIRSEYPDANIMDGIRVDLDKSWFLIRASNTTPTIRITAEGKQKEKAEQIVREHAQRIKEMVG